MFRHLPFLFVFVFAFAFCSLFVKNRRQTNKVAKKRVPKANEKVNNNNNNASGAFYIAAEAADG